LTGELPGVVLSASPRAVTVALTLPGGGTSVDTFTPNRVRLDPAAPVTVWLEIDRKDERP
jgi:hypothetical protein